MPQGICMSDLSGGKNMNTLRRFHYIYFVCLLGIVSSGHPADHFPADRQPAAPAQFDSAAATSNPPWGAWLEDVEDAVLKNETSKSLTEIITNNKLAVGAGLISLYCFYQSWNARNREHRLRNELKQLVLTPLLTDDTPSSTPQTEPSTSTIPSATQKPSQPNGTPVIETQTTPDISHLDSTTQTTEFTPEQVTEILNYVLHIAQNIETNSTNRSMEHLNLIEMYTPRNYKELEALQARQAAVERLQKEVMSTEKQKYVLLFLGMSIGGMGGLKYWHDNYFVKARDIQRIEKENQRLINATRAAAELRKRQFRTKQGSEQQAPQPLASMSKTQKRWLKTQKSEQTSALKNFNKACETLNNILTLQQAKRSFVPTRKRQLAPFHFRAKGMHSDLTFGAYYASHDEAWRGELAAFPKYIAQMRAFVADSCLSQTEKAVCDARLTGYEHAYALHMKKLDGDE